MDTHASWLMAMFRLYSAWPGLQLLMSFYDLRDTRAVATFIFMMPHRNFDNRVASRQYVQLPNMASNVCMTNIFKYDPAKACAC